MNRHDRRRQRAQESAAMKAARRSLGERGPVRVEDFVCPDGLLALTLDAGGYVSTVLIDPAKLVDVDAALTIAAAKSDYRTIVRAIAHEFVASRKRGDDSRLPGLRRAMDGIAPSGERREHA